jgi:hypothetical protein
MRVIARWSWPNAWCTRDRLGQAVAAQDTGDGGRIDRAHMDLARGAAVLRAAVAAVAGTGPVSGSVGEGSWGCTSSVCSQAGEERFTRPWERRWSDHDRRVHAVLVSLDRSVAMIRTVEVHDPPDEGLGVSLRYGRIPLFF